MTYRGLTQEQLASYLDHSVLSPIATVDEVMHGAVVALRYSTAAYCVRPMDVSLATQVLRESKVAVATVIGFPHGTSTTESKAFESGDAISNGATELDMVINQSWLLSGEHELAARDIAAVVSAASHAKQRVSVKVILETATLNAKQIALACQIAESSGADFVKTSTGFASRGASVADIRKMRAAVGYRLGVKASGGIGSLDQAIDLIEAGASRIGLSRTEQLFEEFSTKED